MLSALFSRFYAIFRGRLWNYRAGVEADVKKIYKEIYGHKLKSFLALIRLYIFQEVMQEISLIMVYRRTWRDIDLKTLEKKKNSVYEGIPT